MGTQGPHWIPDFVRMEGPADPQLQVLVAEGLDGAVLGGLVNFTCHTTVGPDQSEYSADYPGPLTARLAERYGGVFAFMQGCAGNVWQVDMSVDRPQVEHGTDYTRRMGEALADKATEALLTARARRRPATARRKRDRSAFRNDARRPNRWRRRNGSWRNAPKTSICMRITGACTGANGLSGETGQT